MKCAHKSMAAKKQQESKWKRAREDQNNLDDNEKSLLTSIVSLKVHQLVCQCSVISLQMLYYHDYIHFN